MGLIFEHWPFAEGADDATAGCVGAVLSGGAQGGIVAAAENDGVRFLRRGGLHVDRAGIIRLGGEIVEQVVVAVAVQTRYPGAPRRAITGLPFMKLFPVMHG